MIVQMPMMKLNEKYYQHKGINMLQTTFKKYFSMCMENFASHNFSGEQQNQLSMEYALKLTELEANIKLTQAEALKSIVQSESMIKSVRDNALISKANCYVGFLNVVLNAQNTSANDKGNTHQNNVVSTISKIGTNAQGELDELENYTNILNELKNDILALTTQDNGHAG